ncbi:MAG: hypothetical protein IIX72_03990, partial [Oscillospiraceae bacterium]|nr:hypothetical protein [Oscillospiraceae bacterium]
MKKRFIAALCIVLMLCTLMPMSAAADSPIDKVLCTTSSIPVAQANSKDIYAATSTAGCYIESYIWRRTSDGYIIYQLFGTENVEVEITLRALDGWYFSDAVAVYLNNSPANFYIGEGGKTLTLTRTYSPELWAPSIIKNPGSETVDEGGMASFVASATLTSEYKWYVVNPATAELYSADELPLHFEGVSIGSNREGQFNIHNVPAALDGWHVYCMFKGPGGEVRSSEAKIKVNYETPPPTETPAPTPEPTPEPTTAPVESAAPAQPEPEEENHAHSFSEVWRTDEALHWRECACGMRMSEGSHILRWSEIREASRREPGLSIGRCDSCGYEIEKEVPYNGA